MHGRGGRLVAEGRPDTKMLWTWRVQWDPQHRAIMSETKPHYFLISCQFLVWISQSECVLITCSVSTVP